MQATTAQNPDIDHSDDRVFVTDHAVVMLDGATAFPPVAVPTSIYVDTLGWHLQEALHVDRSASLPSILETAIERTSQDLNLLHKQSPSSTVTIVRAVAGEIEFLILGDNTILLPDSSITDNRINNVAPKLRRKYKNRLAAGNGYDAEHKTLLRKLQARQAEMRNQPGGYWIAGSTPAAARHAITASRPLHTTPWTVLATDGAYNTMHHLGLIEPDTLLAASSEDLAALLRQCHDWEETADPSAQQLPRAKRHDDKSIAVLKFV